MEDVGDDEEHGQGGIHAIQMPGEEASIASNQGSSGKELGCLDTRLFLSKGCSGKVFPENMKTCPVNIPVVRVVGNCGDYR